MALNPIFQGIVDVFVPPVPSNDTTGLPRLNVGQAVLISAEVAKSWTDPNGTHGVAVIDDGWSRYELPFHGEAVVNGTVRGTVQGRKYYDPDIYDIAVENGLAGAVISMARDHLTLVETKKEAA